MIQKIPEKTTQPLDLVTYLLRPEKGYLIGNTFISKPLTPQSVVTELNAYKGINPRVEHPVSHMSLRLAPGEHLTDAQFLTIAANYLSALGYDDCPYFVVRHTDASSEHIHIVVSRIARDGHCVSDSFDWPRGEKLVRQFERQYGLRQVPASDESRRQSLTRGELAQALRNQEPSARQELQEIVSHAAREVQDFPEFVEHLREEDVSLIVHRDRDGRLHGYSYELEGYALSGTQLGRGFTLRGIEQGYGIRPDPELHADLLARITRPSQPATETSAQTTETSNDPLELLRATAREALSRATSFDDYRGRLAASGVELEILPDTLGRPHGLVYRTNEFRAIASSLGKDFTLGALKRRGLTPEQVSTGEAPVSTPGPTPSRDDAATVLVRTIDQVAMTSADFRTFREELLNCGVRLDVHYSETGKPTGLSYQWNDYRWAGKELGPTYTLGGLKRARGLVPERSPTPPRFRRRRRPSRRAFAGSPERLSPSEIFRSPARTRASCCGSFCNPQRWLALATPTRINTSGRARSTTS
ncbi:MAG TPA: relaxase/mobilization nuclease domain-containing protein [Thermoanaerobaculia bacterium]|nr:relaxase/mobilization nuclease domain-containing protein [Thermoanaerobaculia bacterium]